MAVQVEITAAVARVAAGLIALGAATAVIAAVATGSLERRCGRWTVRLAGERPPEQSGGPALTDDRSFWHPFALEQLTVPGPKPPGAAGDA